MEGTWDLGYIVYWENQQRAQDSLPPLLCLSVSPPLSFYPPFSVCVWYMHAYVCGYGYLYMCRGQKTTLDILLHCSLLYSFEMDSFIEPVARLTASKTVIDPSASWPGLRIPYLPSLLLWTSSPLEIWAQINSLLQVAFGCSIFSQQKSN